MRGLYLQLCRSHYMGVPLTSVLSLRQPPWRVSPRFFHLPQLVARPGPSLASGDELVTLPAAQMQVSPADSPALNVAVMLVEFGAGDVPPGEDLHNFFRGVAEEPWANVLSRIQIEESDTPIALHDVTGDDVRPRLCDLLTHRGRISRNDVEAC